MKYVALLRGINVGGTAKVSMAELKKMFEDLGFAEIKTLLNSGNVIFEAEEAREEILQREIEQELEKKFGFSIRVLLRSHGELEQLVREDPFQGIAVTKETRLYVTFLSDAHSLTKENVQKIVRSEAMITRLTLREICSVITITPEKNTTDMMNFLGKLFGKNITTRNWNTIQRLVSL
ncbi:MAG TPA: DUF1697 domain-containing protein [Patescibacteria group bacterium]|nr:DUF1697 domain-containing protein [Patescibacteria group bacterium]